MKKPYLCKEIPNRLQKALLGFASGVMVAASVWSLLIPSMEMGAGNVWPAVIGVLQRAPARWSGRLGFDMQKNPLCMQGLLNKCYICADFGNRAAKGRADAREPGGNPGLYLQL